MKVLLSTFGGDGGKSGISQYIMHLMREFPKVAPETRFDVLTLAGEELLYVTDPERIRAISVDQRYGGALKNLVWQQYAIPGFCRKETYDVAFFPAGNRRLPFWTPCPRVGTFHDISILHVPGKYDWVHHVYNLRVMPALVRRLTHVITISECSRRDLVDYVGVPEERITVVPEAADTTRYYPRDHGECLARVSMRHGLKRPYVLFISRIDHPGKNHARLIRAFSRLKTAEDLPHQLVLAGSDWNRAEEVHAAAAASPYAKDIVFTGFVPDDAVPDLYGGAEVFVFPSLFEGFGLPILEAMASGVPVACSNTSSLPEVAGDAAVFFDPLDESAIEDALCRLLTQEVLRKDCIERGLKHAAQFSWERCARQTVEVLERTAAAARG